MVNCPVNNSDNENNNLPEEIYCILSYEGSSKDVIINYTLLVLNILVVVMGQCLQIRLRRQRIQRMQQIQQMQLLQRIQRRRICGALFSFIFVGMFQIVLCLIVKCYGISIIWCAIGGWIWMDYCNTKSYNHNINNSINNNQHIGELNSNSRTSSRGCDDNGHRTDTTMIDTLTTPLAAGTVTDAVEATSRTPTGNTDINTNIDHGYGCGCGSMGMIVYKVKWHQLTILVIDSAAILYYAIVEEPITTVAHVLAIVVLGIPLYYVTEKVSGGYGPMTMIEL